MNAKEIDASILFIKKTGLPFLVSHQDAEWLSHFTWHLTYKGYVATNVKQMDGSFRAVHLQRMLMTPDGANVVDHINGSKLDNRRENLRIVTNSENCAAARKPQKSISGIRGVHKHGDGWCACYRGKHIGKYQTSKEAEAAWFCHIQKVNPTLLKTFADE
jgi:hypothetical protein